MELGRKIMNLRKDLGSAQRVFANVSTVTPSALSRIESGQHQPRGPAAFHIARNLGVTADYLLDDTASYPPPAREILANLKNTTHKEPRKHRLAVSKREKQIIESLRELESERLVLLQACLAAPRPTCRYAAFLLGAGTSLPGTEEQEMREFRLRLFVEMQKLTQE
ncbi:MAG: helix-turn-helix domain-containing protein [Planctomycetota bacterium]